MLLIRRLLPILLLCPYGIFMAGCDRSPVDPQGAETRDRAAQTEAPQDLESDMPFDRDQAIDSAIALLQAGNTQQAAAKLQEVLITDPSDAEVLFRLARLKADFGDYRAAVELLDSIPADHPDAGLPALGQAADWYLMLEQYDEAESRYRKVLELAGDVAVAHRQLAYLYNRQGRRHEAAVHL
jgi:tetratricopeptide (TPR) repeat protein